MIKQLTILVFALSVLAPLSSTATLIFYKGAQTENYFGADNEERRAWKVIAVIDSDTGSFARILYGTLHGAKRSATGIYTNTHIVQLTGLKSKSETVIARIPTDCQGQEAPGKESIYLAGINANLSPLPGSIISFPRTFTDTGRSLSHTSSSNSPYIVQGTLLLVFNQAETTTSNQSGETLDAAVARVEAQIQALGYAP
jgi:hypothetical protein